MENLTKFLYELGINMTRGYTFSGIKLLVPSA